MAIKDALQPSSLAVQMRSRYLSLSAARALPMKAILTTLCLFLLRPENAFTLQYVIHVLNTQCKSRDGCGYLYILADLFHWSVTSLTNCSLLV